MASTPRFLSFTIFLNNHPFASYVVGILKKVIRKHVTNHLDGFDSTTSMIHPTQEDNLLRFEFSFTRTTQLSSRSSTDPACYVQEYEDEKPYILEAIILTTHLSQETDETHPGLWPRELTIVPNESRSSFSPLSVKISTDRILKESFSLSLVVSIEARY